MHEDVINVVTVRKVTSSSLPWQMYSTQTLRYWKLSKSFPCIMVREDCSNSHLLPQQNKLCQGIMYPGSSFVDLHFRFSPFIFMLSCWKWCTLTSLTILPSQQPRRRLPKRNRKLSLKGLERRSLSVDLETPDSKLVHVNPKVTIYGMQMVIPECLKCVCIIPHLQHQPILGDVKRQRGLESALVHHKKLENTWWCCGVYCTPWSRYVLCSKLLDLPR